MKKLGHWLLLCGWVLCVLSCGGSSSSAALEAESAGPAQTTVLVYMVGSDLESQYGLASANLLEMQKVALTSQVRLVLQTGGANKPGWRTVQRQQVHAGRIDLLSDLGSPDMAQMETLRDFITWGMAQYPAKRYVLMLWNHGGGANVGFGDDEISQKTMSVPALQTALQQALGSASRKLDVIGFDACLMATVEVADVLSPFANYLVASQAVEPGQGWDWTALLARLVQEPAVNGLDFGRTIADSFMAKLARLGQDSQATLSVVDLKQLPPLVTALGAAANVLGERLTTDVTQHPR
jgi:hypothetical protein